LNVDVRGAVLVRLHSVEGVDSAIAGDDLGDVLVTGRPITANDPALYRHLGVDIQNYDILVWKVKNHFRAAFEEVVGRIVPVDAPGAAQTDFTQLNYAHADTSYWPFDKQRNRGEVIVDRRLK
jgi:microcystin degradation protein MlrC